MMSDGASASFRRSSDQSNRTGRKIWDELKKAIRLHIKRTGDEVDVLLLPFKDNRGWSYVNLTKGHICTCVFPDVEEALKD